MPNNYNFVKLDIYILELQKKIIICRMIEFFFIISRKEFNCFLKIDKAKWKLYEVS